MPSTEAAQQQCGEHSAHTDAGQLYQQLYAPKDSLGDQKLFAKVRHHHKRQAKNKHSGNEKQKPYRIMLNGKQRQKKQAEIKG